MYRDQKGLEHPPQPPESDSIDAKGREARPEEKKEGRDRRRALIPPRHRRERRLSSPWKSLDSTKCARRRRQRPVVCFQGVEGKEESPGSQRDRTPVIWWRRGCPRRCHRCRRFERGPRRRGLSPLQPLATGRKIG